MAKDVADIMRDTVTQVIRDATKGLGDRPKVQGKNSPLSGMKGVAAGAGLATVAPFAAKEAGKAVKRRFAGDGGKSVAEQPAKAVRTAASKLGGNVAKGVGDKVKQTVDESGGVGGLAKEAGEAVLPFAGKSGGAGQDGVPGVGQGRRMPVQQHMDVAVPIETAYNQWTQFEDWPTFMHRVTRVTQDDPCKVTFATKIWGKTKEFTAEIETQRPDERIKWTVAQGITHTGVVTFHELAPRLTRIELTVDVEPGSLLEKAARGMRHIKRAMRADLHRFKAYIEIQEEETGAWRGVIEDGELVEDHDPSYDEEREYSGTRGEHAEQDEERDDEDQPDVSASEEEEEEQPEEEPEEEQEEDQETQRARTQRFARQAASSSGRRSSGKSSAGGGDGRSAGSRSGSSSGSRGQRDKPTSRR